jgi:hypothetical protein
MVIHLLHFVVMWLNNFPVANGISTTRGPCKIILRHCLDYTHHCCAPFGAYCEAHKENTPTNDMTTRRTPAICIGPTGNFQGTYNFLSLVQEQVIKCCHFDELPVPDVIIAWVSALAKKWVFHKTSSLQTDTLFLLTGQMKLFKLWMMTLLLPILTYLPRCRECFLVIHLHPLHQRPLPLPQHLTQTGHSLLKWLFTMIIGEADPCPPAPEVIIADDEDDTPLPPAVKKNLFILFPRLNLTHNLPHN